jgi:hypothetical protein
LKKKKKYTPPTYTNDILGKYSTPEPIAPSDPERNAIDKQERDSPSPKCFPSTKESAPPLDQSQCGHCATDTAAMPYPTWPINLIQIISEIASTQSSKPKTPEFDFRLTKEAAENNAKVLAKYDNNLERAICAQARSPVGYGSEFRPTDQLVKLFGLHPCWSKMQAILTRGSKWTLDYLEEDQRKQDIEDALAFGNHKGAQKKPAQLRTLVEKDVIHGYGLPLPLRNIRTIPGVVIAPMNIASQNTINDLGQIIKKDRLTHDQSFEWSSGRSVNNRVNLEDFMPCMFGKALLRMVNWAVAARHKFPKQRIFASKIDFKSAFRRCHLNADTALQTCTHLPEDELAIVSLRLSFGGRPCPQEWGALAEPICDLTNTILKSDDWNPTGLFSPGRP